MASTFGWLDTDTDTDGDGNGDGDQRRRVLEVVDLLRESGTVDELGTGGIRDAFSNVVWPDLTDHPDRPLTQLNWIPLRRTS